MQPIVGRQRKQWRLT